jgi:hypothetical protein
MQNQAGASRFGAVDNASPPLPTSESLEAKTYPSFQSLETCRPVSGHNFVEWHVGDTADRSSLKPSCLFTDKVERAVVGTQPKKLGMVYLGDCHRLIEMLAER